MKKIILLLCITAAAQSVRAEEFEHDLFHDEAPALSFEVQAEPEKKSVALKDVPKIAAVYAYYNYVKPLLVAVKIIEDEEGVAG